MLSKRREWRPQQRSQREELSAAKPKKTWKKNPVIEWEKVHERTYDVRVSHIRDAFRPRGYEYGPIREPSGGVEVVESANSRSKN